MKIKDFIKKGSLITLSASIILAPVAEAIAKEYELNNSVQVYNKAENAKNRDKTVKTYPKGKYYIYKEVDGMINITKNEGKPGAWINPADNIKDIKFDKEAQKAKPVEKPTVKKETKTEVLEYIVKEKLAGYINSGNAKAEKNAVATLKPGKYHVYRRHNGMINLTKQVGVPGAWINPNTGKLEAVKTEVEVNTTVESPDVKIENTNFVKSGKYLLVKEINGYMNSDNAISGKNPVRKVEKGEYYIYKIFKNMINISKKENSPGIWVNPKDGVVVENVKVIVNMEEDQKPPKPKEVKENTDFEIGSEYELKEDTSGHIRATDALNKINKVSTVKKRDIYYL